MLHIRKLLFVLLVLFPVAACAASDDGIKRLEDIAYGTAKLQKIDVYLKKNGHSGAPIIVMVHGGAWVIGDKSNVRVASSKAAYWVPKGYIVVSVNYRMAPEADAYTQAMDVAAAVAYVQRHASEWGGDPRKLILMGHSAGAHLVGLITANPQLAASAGVKPWLGSVLLDSAALDLVTVMTNPHKWFFDKAFGSDMDYWRKTSPLHQLTASSPPTLLVCSLPRGEKSCGAARRYQDAAKKLGVQTMLYPRNMSHSEINIEVGKPGEYTEYINRFISALVK